MVNLSFPHIKVKSSFNAKYKQKVAVYTFAPNSLALYALRTH